MLERHFSAVADEIETACRTQRGEPLEKMATALITAYVAAKARKASTSVALHSVIDDIDGAEVAQRMATRFRKAIAEMLASSQDKLTTDPRLAASILQSTMTGVSRRMLEPGSPEADFAKLREELLVMAVAYLKASSVRQAS